MADQHGEDQILTGLTPEEHRDFLAWRERVRGTNVSEKTLLATDYLNHFNEIVMLAEMVPDMPEMLADCEAWTPKGYQEHFRDSGFRERELAIEAYEHVPRRFREAFEATIQQMDAVVAFTLGRLADAIADRDDLRLRHDCRMGVDMMQRIIQVANGIIHGSAHVMDQAEIDATLGR
jgi:hypothetical protein